MVPDASFPPFANTMTVLIIFAAELVILHLILVVWFRLGKVAWKAVDYVWLGFAAFGLIGAAGQARQLIANNIAGLAQQQVQGAYALFRSSLDLYSSEGPVCRTFVRSAYSPPREEFDRAQKDYDAVCQWFKQVAAKLPRTANAFTGPIQFA